MHLMVGTGALAPHLIAAHAAVRPIRETRIWGRDPAKAAALAARLAACRDRRRRRTRSRRGRGCRRHHHLRDAVARAAGARARGSNPARISIWSAPTARTCARPTTTPSAAPASLSIPRRRCTRPATSSSRCDPARSRRDRIAGDLFGLARGDLRRTASRRRDHAVQIGRHRARRPRRRQTGIRPLRGLMNIIANFAKFMGYRGCLDEALRLRDAAVRGLRLQPIREILLQISCKFSELKKRLHRKLWTAGIRLTAWRRGRIVSPVFRLPRRGRQIGSGES